MCAHLGGALYPSGGMFSPHPSDELNARAQSVKIACGSGNSKAQIFSEEKETMFQLIKEGMAL